MPEGRAVLTPPVTLAAGCSRLKNPVPLHEDLRKPTGLPRQIV
jgi:hypothetical protein